MSVVEGACRFGLVIWSGFLDYLTSLISWS